MLCQPCSSTARVGRPFHRCGFTRIELVVCLAIAALLVAVLLTMLSTARHNAQIHVCLAGKQRLATAWTLYTQDHNGQLPGAFTWIAGELNYAVNNPDNTNFQRLSQGQLGPYHLTMADYKCPADLSRAAEGSRFYPRVRTTSMNQMLRSESAGPAWTTSPPWRIYRTTADVIFPSPANLWLMLDENPDSVNDAGFAVIMDRQKWGACWQDGPGLSHGGACTFNFADGHALLKKWQDPQTLTLPLTYREQFPYNVVQPYNLDVQWLQDRTTAWQ